MKEEDKAMFHVIYEQSCKEVLIHIFMSLSYTLVPIKMGWDANHYLNMNDPLASPRNHENFPLTHLPESPIG